jgi:hypothetical protein
MQENIRFAAPLWRWYGMQNGSWFFVTVQGAEAEAIAAHALIRRLETGRARGFGSVKVTVHIGGSSWRTSVFPTRQGEWWLPVKAAIRRAEGIVEGDTVDLWLELD